MLKILESSYAYNVLLILVQSQELTGYLTRHALVKNLVMNTKNWHLLEPNLTKSGLKTNKEIEDEIRV